MDEQDYHSSLIRRVNYHFRVDLKIIKECVETIEENHAWKSPNPDIPPIGNQILHIEGNMRQWILHGLYAERDQRQRNWEFEVKGLPIVVVVEKLSQTVTEILNRLKTKPMDLRFKTDVQGYMFDGIGKLCHVMEHFSYHTGQIVLLSKMYGNGEIDFYSEV